MTNDQVILSPLVTEKSTMATETANQVVFRVRHEAGKDKIRGAIEELFKVTVVAVRTSNSWVRCAAGVKSKGRQRNWKKAYVTLKEGDKIEFFEGSRRVIFLFCHSEASVSEAEESRTRLKRPSLLQHGGRHTLIGTIAVLKWHSIVSRSEILRRRCACLRMTGADSGLLGKTRKK